MKKLSLLFFTLMLTLVLTACGDDSEKSKTDDTNKTQEAEADNGTEIIEAEEDESEDKADEANSNAIGSFYADALKEDIPFISDEQLELSQESYEFIKKNNEILPAKTPENIETAKSKAETIDLKQLNKNVSSFYSTIASFEGEVIQIEEEEFENGEVGAWVNIYDDNANNHILYIYKSTGDILEEDRIQFWGVPVGAYSYETLDGGYQNAHIFFGAHIEKK